MKVVDQSHANGHQIRDMYITINFDPVFENGAGEQKHEGRGMEFHKPATNKENAGEGACHGIYSKDEKPRFCESALREST